MISHIRKSYGLNTANTPTIIYKDNTVCVTQIQTGYVKSNLTKHVTPKFFYPHDVQKQGEIKILQVWSCDNLVDLFTKSLSATTFRKFIQGIGMRSLKDLQRLGGEHP
jgi:hypothetical protein